MVNRVTRPCLVFFLNILSDMQQVRTFYCMQLWAVLNMQSYYHLMWVVTVLHLESNSNKSWLFGSKMPNIPNIRNISIPYLTSKTVNFSLHNTDIINYLKSYFWLSKIIFLIMLTFIALVVVGTVGGYNFIVIML